MLPPGTDELFVAPVRPRQQEPRLFLVPRVAFQLGKELTPLGKLLNIARLVRAAGTFEGAARYAAWKVERHTGVTVELTPWRERHPVLAAPGVLWRVWRERKAAR